MEWEAHAKAYGYDYSVEAPEIRGTFPELKIFKKGHSPRVFNCIRTTRDGVEVIVTDYSYVVGHGKNRSYYGQTLCILDSKDLNLPGCFARRENRFFDFIGKVFGAKDINFYDDKSFSDAFILNGLEVERIRRLFDQEVRDQFCAVSDRKLVFEGKGRTIVIHYGRHLAPSEMDNMLEDAFTLFEALKNSEGNRA